MPGELRTVTGHAATPSYTLWRCSDCAALIEPDQVWKHETWHQQHPAPGPPPTPEWDTFTRVSLTFESEIKKQIDGLYILLGEDPPFNEEPEPAHAPGT